MERCATTKNSVRMMLEMCMAITLQSANMNKWLVKPLTPKLYSFQTTFSICMPTTHHIFISVQALTPKLNPSALAAIISRLVTLTTPTH